MLDNNEINEQFINESWEKMRLSLDAEMPVDEPRKKRGIIWFWPGTIGIAATILLTGLGIWWLTTDVLPSGDSSIAMVKEATSDDSATAAITIRSESESVQPAQIQSGIKESFVESSNAVVLPGAAARTTNRRYAENKAAVYHPLSLQQQQAVAASDAAVLEPLKSIENQHALTVEAMMSTSAKDALLLEHAAFAGFSPVANGELALLPSQEADLQMPAIPVDKLAKNWRHGPEVGGIVTYPASIAGFNAGWAAEVPVGEGLALHGAMRYDFQRQTVASDERQLDTRQESTGIYDVDPFNPSNIIASADLNPDTVFSSTLKMHYASLPLSLSMRLNERWRVEGGMQVAYLFRAFRENRQGSDFTFTAPGTQQDASLRQSWYFSNKAQQVASESFQPWDLALSAGLRYQVTRNWHVGLSGNYGFLNQANKSNGYRIFNRNAVLSLGYYF